MGFEISAVTRFFLFFGQRDTCTRCYWKRTKFPIHKVVAIEVGQMFITCRWKSRLKHSTAEFQSILQLDIVSYPHPPCTGLRWRAETGNFFMILLWLKYEATNYMYHFCSLLQGLISQNCKNSGWELTRSNTGDNFAGNLFCSANFCLVSSLQKLILYYKNVILNFY